MVEPEDRFYTEERWQNWLTRIEEEEFDPDDEDSYRLLWNLQEDAAIAVAKILSAYEEDRLDDDETVEELERLRDIVLAEPELEDVDEEKLMLVETIQSGLNCALYAAEEYVVGGVPEEDATVEDYVFAAAEAEDEENLDAAFGYLIKAGTRIVDGDELDVSVSEEFEPGFVSNWVDGLVSLQSAMREPEVIEDDEE
jgi:hypothetical protein